MKLKQKNRVVSILAILLLLTASIGSTVSASEKINFSYIYSVGKNEYIKYVDQTNNSIDVIAPNYFDLSKDGKLVITDKFDANFIKEMKKRNVKVVPFLSNHWDKVSGKAAIKNKEALATQLVSEIKKHDLDGVNIDMEGLSHTEKDGFTQLIKVLSEKMPADKELSVAVAANPRGLKQGWHGSYDYEALAKYADYLVIMAYDESYTGSDPGPVASLDFVEKSIKYPLNLGISSDKIVVGVPFYGRIWNLEDVKAGKGVRGDGIWMNKISSFIENYNGQIDYVESKGSLVGRATIKANDPVYQLFSWKEPFKPGNYEIWFDNEQTIQQKLELVTKYNLKGTANWSLGQESPTLWTQYSAWLNSTAVASKPPSKSTSPKNMKTTDIQVFINGKALTFDQPPYIHQNKTLVPLRGIFEELEATVNWDSNLKEITAMKGDKSIWLKANSTIAKINETQTVIDVPVQIKDGRTMVPLRFISESLGANVEWQAETKTVLIQ